MILKVFYKIRNQKNVFAVSPVFFWDVSAHPLSNHSASGSGKMRAAQLPQTKDEIRSMAISVPWNGGMVLFHRM